jgi:hypothetical protein
MPFGTSFPEEQEHPAVPCRCSDVLDKVRGFEKPGKEPTRSRTAREKASRFTPGKIKELGLGSLFSAGLLFTEGIGLSLLKGCALQIPDRWVMSATINRI